MRKKLLSLVLIGAIALLLSLSIPVAAQPPPIFPHAFYGDVIIDGSPAPDDTEVTAHIGPLSWSTETSGGTYGYTPEFYIPADDPYWGIEGGHDGDPITFRVEGDYAATSTFYRGGATRLDLIIGAPPEVPHISFSPADFEFNATEGGANPPSQTLYIWNSGGGTLDWEVSDDVGWLELSPTSGSSTGETDAVTVSVDITGMTANGYPATITITDPDADNSPQEVDVMLNISLPLGPTIAFSPASLTFNATYGGANPPDKILEIWNSGSDTLEWTVSDTALWLGFFPTDGESTGEHDPVTVSVDITGVSVGSHASIIYIAAVGATNTPQEVLVTLNIRKPAIGGTAYIPTKPSILWPWIGLLALAVGLGIFGWRRRRARQRSIG